MLLDLVVAELLPDVLLVPLVHHDQGGVARVLPGQPSAQARYVLYKQDFDNIL